jgi:hypothetical protein
MKQIYMVMGEFDFVGICEAPPDAVMARYVPQFGGLGFVAAIFRRNGGRLARRCALIRTSVQSATRSCKRFSLVGVLNRCQERRPLRGR